MNHKASLPLKEILVENIAIHIWPPVRFFFLPLQLDFSIYLTFSGGFTLEKRRCSTFNNSLWFSSSEFKYSTERNAQTYKLKAFLMFVDLAPRLMRQYSSGIKGDGGFG